MGIWLMLSLMEEKKNGGLTSVLIYWLPRHDRFGNFQNALNLIDVINITKDSKKILPANEGHWVHVTFYSVIAERGRNIQIFWQIHLGSRPTVLGETDVVPSVFVPESPDAHWRLYTRSYEVTWVRHSFHGAQSQRQRLDMASIRALNLYQSVVGLLPISS